MSTIDLEHLRQWVGRERSVHGMLSVFPAQALSAALDHADVPVAGDALPPAWQWLYFVDTPRASATGKDGHPALGPDAGSFLPPVPLPRRMWAAGSFDVLQALKLGQAAVRTTAIKSVEAKTGKSGTLVFVTLAHQISQDGQLCVREAQNLVYREMPTAPAPLPPGEPAPTDADWTRTITPDPVLLFRYSALSYNGHRIHYDRPYAIEQEFYPALVVHGPLLATLLLDLLHEKLPDVRVASYRFRAMRPTFDTSAFQISGKRDGDSVSLWTTDHEGCLGMSATARLA
jgi:3-methylfumaryl-CoA hydratase